MILIIFCTIIYLFFLINDMISVYKSEKRIVFWVYLAVFAFSYILSILIKLDVDLPSPAIPIKQIVTSIFG